MMMKTKRLGVVLAMLLAACGTESPRAEQEPRNTEEEVQSGTSCEDIEQVVEHVRNGLGSCTPNYKNQEPLAFNRPECETELPTICGPSDEASIQAYVACLQAVTACNPAQQEVFDEAIDECLDTFQNSDADYLCVDVVVGD
ncbi:hypothetical protein ACLESD_41210 [Pyxidicoccus sp. 3LFB2]